MSNWYDWFELTCVVIGTLICVYLIAVGEFKPFDWFEEEEQ